MCALQCAFYARDHGKICVDIRKFGSHSNLKSHYAKVMSISYKATKCIWPVPVAARSKA